MPQPQTPETISTLELASRIGVHEKTIRRHCLAGRIPEHCYTKGGLSASYRFLSAAVAYFCDHGRWPERVDMARYARASRLTHSVDSRAEQLVARDLAGLPEALAEVEDQTVLYEALALELKRRNREGALAAMRSRLLELEGQAASAA